MRHPYSPASIFAYLRKADKFPIVVPFAVSRSVLRGSRVYRAPHFKFFM